MSLIQDDVLLGILLENRVLVAQERCREVCKCWASAALARITEVRIAALFADETGVTSPGGVLGTFLRKLPNLERLDFDPRFRKRWAGAVPEDEAHAPEEEDEVSSPALPSSSSNPDAPTEHASPRKTSASPSKTAEHASPGKARKTDAIQGLSLRRSEKLRMQIAVQALQGVAVRHVALPFCRVTTDELNSLLGALAASAPYELQTLEIPGNFVGVEGAKVLGAHSNGALSRLITLDIRGNDLTAAGIVLLAAAPLSPSLQTLRVGENALSPGEDSARALSALVRSCAALTCLDLSEAKLRPGFAILFETLAHSPALRDVDLSQCSLGEEGAREVAGLIRTSRSLAAVKLARNDFSGGAAAHIAGAAADNPYMELLALDISRNPIGEGGCAALCDLLLAPNCVLQTLDVSEAQLFSSGCTVLMGALSHNATIRTLLLSSNAIGPQGGTAIAEALLSDAACGALTSLDVSNNDLDSAGFAAVAHAAAATPRLHTLDLSHNNAGAAGLEALGEAYEHLAFLSRGGPFLDSRGGPVHSGGGLSRVPHLAELNLAFNNAPCVSARARFGAEDGPASGAAGAVGRRARRAGEEADDGAGRWLETMLRACPKLRALDLSYNGLGDGIAIHLHNALSQGGGAGLEELRLRGNALSLDGLTRVGEAFASNLTLSHRVKIVDVADSAVWDAERGGEDTAAVATAVCGDGELRRLSPDRSFPGLRGPPTDECEEGAAHERRRLAVESGYVGGAAFGGWRPWGLRLHQVRVATE